MALSYKAMSYDEQEPASTAEADGEAAPAENPVLLVEQEGAVSAKNEPDLSQQKSALAIHDQIAALYDEFSPQLYHYVQSMRVGEDQVDEVIQETFLRLTAHLLKHDQDENIRGWIVRVAHNLASDVRKKNHRRWKDSAEEANALTKERADPSLSPEEIYLEKEHLGLMEKALDTFNSQHRHSFLMRAEGFRYKDIGDALGFSEQRAAQLVKKVSVRLAVVRE
jgi:RNA polymerase sigma-70 factor (ECF subfamily)